MGKRGWANVDGQARALAFDQVLQGMESWSIYIF
jgi:hypothetical protein